MSVNADTDMDALFEIEAPPPVSLADRFGVPPFSIFDRRSGHWQDRKRRWLSLGIESEVGRQSNMLRHSSSTKDPQFYDKKTAAEAAAGRPLSTAEFLAEHYDPDSTTQRYLSGTSIFDPVVCELAYRWFTAPGWDVLDPFAGGSVRGITAALLDRRYTGIDLRPEQIAANEAQVGIVPDGLPKPQWIAGDSLVEVPALPREYEADLIFTCPPYADLEQSSDDPRDLSNMRYPQFLDLQTEIMGHAADRLRDNRFVVWVTSDVRDGRSVGNAYYGLVADTITRAAGLGLALYNDIIILDNVGSGAMRGGRQMVMSRKMVRMHQHMLVFCNGDGIAAARDLNEAGAGVGEAIETADGEAL